MAGRARGIVKTVTPMENELIDTEEQLERCRRLASLLTDEQMRKSLEQLARDYEAKLKRERRSGGEGFMLRQGSG